jgi:hypothetical protein
MIASSGNRRVWPNSHVRVATKKRPQRRGTALRPLDCRCLCRGASARFHNAPRYRNVPVLLLPDGVPGQELHHRPRHRTRLMEVDGPPGRKDRQIRRRPITARRDNQRYLADRPGAEARAPVSTMNRATTIKLAVLLLTCLSLLGCADGRTAGERIADMPYWMGGLPEGIPPRRGTPEYDAWMAQRAQEAARPKTDQQPK